MANGGVDLSRIIAQENLGPTLAASVAWNVDLIESIPTRYFAGLRNAIFSNMTAETAETGLSATVLATIVKDIGKVTKTSRNQAKLIARDQTQKLNANINQVRQENLGIEEYIWQTAEDERVRETHEANNGQKFRWDEPPAETGHPGQDISCRCTARAVVNI